MTDEYKIDAELIGKLADSLDQAAQAMRPDNDQLDISDVVQVLSVFTGGRRGDTDTLQGSSTDAGNFGTFDRGQSLHQVYSVAHKRAVGQANRSADIVHRYAQALRDTVKDMQKTEELTEQHFAALVHAMPKEKWRDRA